MDIKEVFEMKMNMREKSKCIIPKKDVFVLLSAVAALAMAAIFLSLFPARFETNDDIAMAEIAYGVNGQYDSHLVYINVIIGHMLQKCLEILPAIPWYTVFQISLIYVSFAVFFYLLLEKFGCRAFLPAMILIVFFGYQYFTRIQYTKTSGISIIAGFLLLFYATEQRRRLIACMIGMGLIVAGSMYRFQVLEMLCILFFGVGAQKLYDTVKGREVKEIMRLCVPFVAVLAICCGLNCFNDWLYSRDPQWSDYVRFNALRTELLDYGFPSYEENRELYNSLDITQSGYTMYHYWEIGDPEYFNVETMQKLVEAKNERQFDHALIKGFVTEIPLGMLKYWYTKALFITVLACLLPLKKRHAFVFSYACCGFVLIQLYLYYKGRYLRNRVDVSIVLAITMILLLYACTGEILGRRGLGVLLAGVLLLTALPKHLEYLSEEPGDSKEYLFRLFHTDPEHLYVATVSGPKSDLFNLWNVEPVGLKSNYVSTGGWRTASPLVLRVLDAYDIGNPYRDVIDNPNAYMICNTNIDLRLNYIREHYAENANAFCVKDINGDCRVYRIATAEVPPIQLDRVETIPDDGWLNWEVNDEILENEICLSGYLYAEQKNSFASNIYIGLRSPDGTEDLFYTTQGVASFSDDNMNGAYSAFECTLEKPLRETSIVLYLETDNVVYCVETNIHMDGINPSEPDSV